MKKKKYCDEDLQACNHIALSLIAQQKIEQLLKNMKEGNMPFTTTMFFGLLRTNQIAWLPEFFLNSYCMDDEIIKIILKEKIYNQEELDDHLITNESAAFASTEELVKRKLWQALADKQEFEVLAKNASEHPEIWIIFDKEAPLKSLTRHNRVDELIRRNEWLEIAALKCGADTIISHKKIEAIKEYFKFYTFKSNEDNKKMIIFAVENDRDFDICRLNDKAKKLLPVEFYVKHKCWEIVHNIDKSLVDYDDWIEQINRSNASNKEYIKEFINSLRTTPPTKKPWWKFS